MSQKGLLRLLLHNRHHHTCALGHKATLLADIRETHPRYDAAGNYLYYCPKCMITFAVDAKGRRIEQPPAKNQE